MPRPPAFVLGSLLVSVLVLGVACWTAPVAPPPAAAAQPARPTRPPGAITCEDAAAILRGKVPDEDTDGPPLERAIAEACVADRWPNEVLDCVGAGRSACLDRLSRTQRRGYDRRVERARAGEPEPDDSD